MPVNRSTVHPVADRTRRWTHLLLIILLCVANTTHAQSTTQPTKKLIEFGWDEPDTAYMREHIDDMEKTPFDGCVFHLTYPKLDGSTAASVWETWGQHAFTPDDFAKARADLLATPFKHLTHNFLRFNTAPGDIDWFDDFAPILNNAKLHATIAREGHAAGLLFDIEQYNAQLFNYRKQRDAAIKSWDEYAAQARQRGREVMQAFQSGYPDLTIFMTWATSLPYLETNGDTSKLPDASYGLLAPFLDGMLEAAQGGTTIVDGFESAYSYKDTTQFAPARDLMKTRVLALVGPDEQHRKHVSAGFGVWMDNDWRTLAWDESDFSKNFYTPDAFQKTVRAAWETSDEYVWIYTEVPRWWSKDSKPEKLPAAYDTALRRAVGR
jgi:hypothetical protein